MRLSYVTLLLPVFVLLSACRASDEINAARTIASNKRVWVQAQFNVPEEGGKIDSYWYYGRAPQKLVELIQSNNIEQGFISLEDIRYWGDGDKLYHYEDVNYTGELVFRVEHIHKLTLLKREPNFDDEVSETTGEDSAEDESLVEEPSKENLLPAAPRSNERSE